MQLRDQQGLSFVEVLVALGLTMLLLVAVLGAYSQGHHLKTHVEGNVKIQSNLRIAMDRVTGDLRMMGFGVPDGVEIGGTATWAPAIFYASGGSLGFRGDIDGGFSEIICTPSSSNSNCPLTKLRLESISYYQDWDCKRPDGATGSLELIASFDGGVWERFACSGFTTSNNSINVAGVPNNTLTAGISHATTVEQVYYRYIPGSQPPDYGRLERYVRYENMPSDTFPPTGVTWAIVARHLIDFSFEFRDENDNVISGNPLNQAKREAVRKVVIFIEGFNRTGTDGAPQQLQMRSEIFARNM